MRREWERIFAIYTSDRRLISRIYKELENKSKNQPSKQKSHPDSFTKWAWNSNRGLLNKEKQWWLRNSSKNVPSPQQLEKCISKITEILSYPSYNGKINKICNNEHWRGCRREVSPHPVGQRAN